MEFSFDLSLYIGEFASSVSLYRRVVSFYFSFWFHLVCYISFGYGNGGAVWFAGLTSLGVQQLWSWLGDAFRHMYIVPHVSIWFEIFVITWSTCNMRFNIFILMCKFVVFGELGFQRVLEINSLLCDTLLGPNSSW